MYLSIVRYHQTAIPSGVAKISSFYEENLSDPNPQTGDIKSGIRAENLGLGYCSQATKCTNEIKSSGG